MWEKRRKENRQRVVEERKYFVCGGFKHIICYCRNRKEEESVLMPSNRLEVLEDKHKSGYIIKKELSEHSKW